MTSKYLWAACAAAYAMGQGWGAQAQALTPAQAAAGAAVIEAEAARQRSDAQRLLTAPRTPDLQPTVSAAAPMAQSVPQDGDVRFTLTGVSHDASRILPPGAVEGIAAEYVGRPVTLSDLAQMTARINDLYAAMPRYVGHAVIQPQEIADGVLRLTLIEATLERVAVDDGSGLREGFVEARVGAQPGDLVDLDAIRQATTAFNRRRSVVLAPTLEPGSALGDSVLRVRAEAPPPWTLSAGVDNYGSESTGMLRKTAALRIESMSGRDDPFAMSVLSSEGVKTASAAYGRPVGAGHDAVNMYVMGSSTSAVGGVGAEIGTSGSSALWHLDYESALYDDADWRVTGRLAYDGSEAFSLIGALGRSVSQHGLSVSLEGVRYFPRAVLKGEAKLSAAYYKEEFDLDVYEGVDPRAYLTLDAAAQPFAEAPWLTVGARAHVETLLREIPNSNWAWFMGGKDSLAGYDPAVFEGDSGYLISLEAAATHRIDGGRWPLAAKLRGFIQHGGAFEGPLYAPVGVSRYDFGASAGLGLDVTIDDRLTLSGEAAWGLDGSHADLHGHEPRVTFSVGLRL